ncbi:MAG: hypothetical protein JSV84_05935 [Gemmatimonadota bacterium]|nr:MAG: hypothetical protein JSV84_05935 [Gemmatimonadota bacterium]
MMFFHSERGELWTIVAVSIIMIAVLVEPGVTQPWEVGDTASFWAYDFHFFREYYRTRMTLRAIGDHCYVWVQDSSWNKGNIDSNDVVAILEAFEEVTPAADDTASGILSDTRGVYDELTDMYGLPPDVDGDPRIYILILDCTEGMGAAAMPGYFDPVNQLNRAENSHSNAREMIYIDCNPFDPGTDGLWSMAQQFTHLLLYGNDPDEECWLHEGLTYLSQFLCGYGVANPGIFSRQPLLWYLQSHLSNDDCREQPEIQDQVKTVMFMQYLFEHYGIDVIRTLAADTEHSGTEVVTAALAANGYVKVDFDSVFVDEQLAWFLDAPENWFYGGKYSFKYYDSGYVLDAKTFTYWGTLDTSPYFFSSHQWSADYIIVLPPAPCLTNPFLSCYNPFIYFYGDLDYNFRLIGIKTRSPYLMPFESEPDLPLEFLTLDDRNQTSIDVSDFGEAYETLFLGVIHKGAKDGTQSKSRYLVHNEYPVFPPPRNLAAQDRALEKVPLFWVPPFLSSEKDPEGSFTEGVLKRSIGKRKMLFYEKRTDSVGNTFRETGLMEYRVYRGDVSGGPYEMIASSNTLGYEDASVIATQTYYYVVTAVYEDPEGESEYSNEVFATPRTLGETATLWTAVSDHGVYGNADFAYHNFEWPGGTENHYNWEGRFWAGAIVDGEERVSHADYGNYEFHPPSGIGTEQYYEIGIENFEVSVTFNDSSNLLGVFPLNLNVFQKALMWPESYPEYDDFLALEISVVNSSIRNYENFFVAWIFDADVCHGDISDPHIDDLVDYDGWDGSDSRTDELPQVYPGLPYDRGDVVDPFDWDGDGNTGYDEWGVPYGDPDNPSYNEALIEPDGFPDEYTLLIDEMRGQRIAFKHPDVMDTTVVYGFAVPRNMSYMYDGDHPSSPENDFQERDQRPYPCEGYIGGRLIYAPNRLYAPEAYYNFSGTDDALSDSLMMPYCHSWWNWEADPGSDAEKLGFMDGGHVFMQGKRYMVNPCHPDFNATVFDYRWLQSTGPFDFPAGDTLKFVYAVGVGRGLQGLRENLDNALRLYYQGCIYSDPYRPSDFDSDTHWHVETASISRGDVNGDGIMNVLDVMAAINHIVGSKPLRGDGLRRADCNSDDRINVLDVVGIVRVILGLGVCSP